jgi:serine/threonine protein kinase
MAMCPSCGEAYEGVNFCPADGTRLPEPDRCELSPLVGEVLDKRYRVIRKVGEGASAEVFFAEHIHLKKKVALKVLRKELAGKSEATERFQREAQVASGIGHRNIVAVEDFCALEDGSFYLAMEWLEGETLDDRIERGPLSIDEAIAVAEQTCSGLEAAHAVAIIHRDLKPANLFLVAGPRGKSSAPLVKILDFGIAKLTLAERQLTRAGAFLGTPFYVSPEQAEGKPIDRRADVYSLGVILYEMVTGEVPFDGETAISVLHQHMRAEPEPPRRRAPELGIPPDLDRIIMRCLQKDPEARYRSAAALADALGDLEPAASATLPGIGLKRSDLGLDESPLARAAPVDDPDELIATTEMRRSDLRRAREQAFERRAERRAVKPARRPRSRRGLVIAGGAALAIAGAIAAAFAYGAFDRGAKTRVDESPALPTRWTLERRDAGLDYRVFISPAHITPGQPFTLELGFADFGDSPGEIQIALGDQTIHAVVSQNGSASAVCQVPATGAYTARMTVTRPGRPAVTTSFDLCVGADPRDSARVAAICPKARDNVPKSRP